MPLEVRLVALGEASDAGLPGHPPGDRAGEGLERGPLRVLRSVHEACVYLLLERRLAEREIVRHRLRPGAGRPWMRAQG